MPTAAASVPAASVSAAADEESEEEEGGADMCVMCESSARVMAAVHGDSAHLCLCADCHRAHKAAEVLQRCPMCRLPVETWLHVHSGL